METISEQQSASSTDQIELTTQIVSAYVANNHVQPGELASLIGNVHATLGSLGQPPQAAEAPTEKPTPVQIRKSVTPDALVSFVDGKPYKTLKRHLTTHGLDIEGYRRRYGLPTDYPTVASNYSAARSALAKDLGLGQQRRKPSTKTAEPADEVVSETPPEPRRKSAGSGEGRKTGGRRKAA